MRAVRREIRCVRCGADLRGYRPVHDCPDCGTPVIESAHAATGPEDAGRCAVCLENLHGVSHRGRCPGCRTPVRLGLVSMGDGPARRTSPFPEALAGPDGRVGGGAAIPCIACGYDVRGLHVTGRCPECATDVRRTLQRGSLHRAPDRHLQRLRDGSTAVLAAGWIALGLLLVELPLLFVLRWAPLPPRVEGLIEATEFVWLAVSILLALSVPVLYVGGVAQIGRPDPTQFASAPAWARVASVAGLPLACIGFILAGAATAGAFPYGASVTAAISDAVIRLLPIGALAAALVGSLSIVEHVGARTNFDALHRHPRALRRSMPLALGPLLLWIIEPLSVRLTGSTVPEWIGCLVLLCGLFSLAWTMAYFGTFGYLRRAVVRAQALRAEAARQWAENR